LRAYGVNRVTNAEAETQTIAIILHIAADSTAEFEAMFEAEELPLWDDFIKRGLFLECSLTRVVDGSEKKQGLQDYILHIVATPEGHNEHDHDQRFRSFLERAKQLQPAEPLVWFGDQIFER
jgi:hypothetical protein